VDGAVPIILVIQAGLPLWVKCCAAAREPFCVPFLAGGVLQGVPWICHQRPDPVSCCACHHVIHGRHAEGAGVQALLTHDTVTPPRLLLLLLAWLPGGAQRTPAGMVNNLHVYVAYAGCGCCCCCPCCWCHRSLR
jgi:hypothetical protein